MGLRGFEFVGMIDGSNATPVIRDVVLGAAAAHHVGDLVLIQSDGYADQVTATTTEVTGVIQEEVAAAAITAGTTKAKIAILTPNQVWRDSSDASSNTGDPGYTNACDTADCRTFDASDTSGGNMVLLSKDTLDDEGNAIAEVLFSNCTFQPI